MISCRDCVYNRKAFSMVEIIFTVIIVIALLLIIFPRILGGHRGNNISVAKLDITDRIPAALKFYELDNGRFPTTEQGLSALVTKPDIAPIPENWNGPYLDKEPIDPWGRPYIYVSPGEHNINYDLYSKGADPDSEEDDIKNWE